METLEYVLWENIYGAQMLKILATVITSTIFKKYKPKCLICPKRKLWKWFLTHALYNETKCFFAGVTHNSEMVAHTHWELWDMKWSYFQHYLSPCDCSDGTLAPKIIIVV